MMLIHSDSDTKSKSTKSLPVPSSSPSAMSDADDVAVNCNDHVGIGVGDDDGIDNPTDVDVLLGRGAGCWNHPGNRKFRGVVHKHLSSYDNAKLRVEKTHIVSVILDEVRANGGRFLKRNQLTEKWRVVDQRVANEKIGHAIRDKRATARSELEAMNEEKSEQGDDHNDNMNNIDLPAFFEKQRQDRQDALNRVSQIASNSNPFITPLLRGGGGAALAAAMRLNSASAAAAAVAANPSFRRDLPLPGLLRNRVPPPQSQLLRQQQIRPFVTPPLPLPPNNNNNNINNPNFAVEQQLQNRHRTLLEQSSTFLQSASEALRNLQTTQQAMEAIAVQRQQQQQQQRQLQKIAAAQSVIAMHRNAAAVAAMTAPTTSHMMNNNNSMNNNPFLARQLLRPPLRLPLQQQQQQINYAAAVAAAAAAAGNNGGGGGGGNALMEFARLSTLLARRDQVSSNAEIVLE